MRTGSTITRAGKRPWRKPPWRGLLLTAAVLAALALAAPLAATFLVGEPELRETARQALASALGRPVEITGPVSLSLFPRPGLRAGGVSVPDPDGGEPFLAADSLSVGVRPLDLFRRRIAVATLSLSGASLRLTRDAQGAATGSPRPPLPALGLMLSLKLPRLATAPTPCLPSPRRPRERLPPSPRRPPPGATPRPPRPARPPGPSRAGPWSPCRPA